MRISDWSSDVCSSDLRAGLRIVEIVLEQFVRLDIRAVPDRDQTAEALAAPLAALDDVGAQAARLRHHADCAGFLGGVGREGEAAARRVGAQTVRPEPPNPGLARFLDAHLLQALSFLQLAEAGGHALGDPAAAPG